jgi:hypothetical protein
MQYPDYKERELPRLGDLPTGETPPTQRGKVREKYTALFIERPLWYIMGDLEERHSSAPKHH